MQLRSIPPLTMNSLLRKRASPTMQERVVQVRQHLLALRESLQTGPPMRLSWGGSPHSLVGASPFGLGRKQSFSSPGQPPRPLDLLIPSRPVPNCEPTEHTLTVTADGCIINITFPVPVRAGEVRWERLADVLEVEYIGKAFTYYHAFMVPTDGEPSVEQEGRSVTFRFPTNA